MGIFDAIANAGIAGANQRAQREQQQYDRDLQQTMFEREDNAVQRQAADMEAAGLSKTLAAGGGAQAGPVVHSTAPQMAHMAPMDMMGIAQTAGQLKLTEAQAAKVLADKKGVDLENSIKEQTLASSVEAILSDNKVKVETTLQRIAKIDRDSYNSYLDQVTKIWEAKYAPDKVKAEADLKVLEAKIMNLYGADRAAAELAAKQLMNDVQAFENKFYQESGLPKGGLFEQIIRMFKGELNPVQQ